MSKLKIVDLFSGIGGFSLGLEWTGGFETVRFCEMKPHARAVLEKNFPGVPADIDVTTMEFSEGEADVITAGFPCQDISYAGDGAGLAGARSGLYREVIRAIRMVRPKWAVLENVAALLSRGLGTVLGDLATVGYDTEWHCIPASAVGASHRRDRIWIITHARSEQHKGRSTPLSGSLASQLLGTDTAGERCLEAGELRHEQSSERLAGVCEEIPDAAGDGSQGVTGCRCCGQGQTQGIHSQSPGGSGRNSRRWAAEPNVGRVAHGVSNRVDRLAELGNAVVPQIPEIIGRAILKAERAA